MLWKGESVLCRSKMKLHIMIMITLDIIGGVATQIVGPRDYCRWDTFNAECQPHEVVIMETAQYGRMELGNCVRNDLGYVGCANDVMDIADTMCSGRLRCKIAVPNPVFERLKPCLEDLKGYFKAGYRCQQVIRTQDDCQAIGKMYRVNAKHGFLSSAVAMETSCGTAVSPWVIAGEPGQRINISLHDFNLANIQSGRDGAVANFQPKVCLKYATLLDDNASESKLVCGTGRRFSHVYTSVGNTVEVRMHDDDSFSGADRNNADKPQYLLEFQVIGCPDPLVPDGASYKREGNVAEVTCHGSDVTWRQTCEGDKWKGSIGSCEGSIQTSQVVLGSLKLPSGLSITIIIVISLLIGCVILGIGLLCLKRQQRRQQIARQRALEEQTYKSTAYSEYSRTVRDNPTGGELGKSGQREVNEYAAIWEWPLPPPPVQQEPTSGNVKDGFIGYQRNYRDDSVSSGDHMYQLPEMGSTGLNEVNPRYFELDPSDPKNADILRTGTGAVIVPSGSPLVGQHGSVPSSPRISHMGHYSN